MHIYQLLRWISFPYNTGWMKLPQIQPQRLNES